MFKDKQTLFGKYEPNEYTIPDYSPLNFPFEFVGDLFGGAWHLLTKRKSEPKQERTKFQEVPISTKSAPPTFAQLRAKLDEDLRHVALLPIEEWEKEEVKAQLELAFLNKTANMMNR